MKRTAPQPYAAKTRLLALMSTLLFFLTFYAEEGIAQPGEIDPTFNPGMGANGLVNTTALQSDGKIIIGGAFTSYNGTARNNIARLNPDGGLDASFNPGMFTNSEAVWPIFPQNDGKIIIGGNFTSYNGTARNRIARLNADGSLDASFDPGMGANGWVYTTSLQSDGKIIIGGNFTSYNGTARNGIARLNADGSLDASFNPGTGFNNTMVLSTFLQSDGKIIIGGGFTSFHGTARNGIARLNADGSLDASFNPGTGANSPSIIYVRTTSLQIDGKIIIGGLFTSYNETARNNVARLNADGSLDASFNPGMGASGQVWSSSLQNDGKIIIGGGFTSYNGTARKGIARVNADGSLDASFNPGTGTNGGVRTTSLQSDGKIIIGGIFSSYNGTARNSIARIMDVCTIPAVTDHPEDQAVSCDGSSVSFTATASGTPAPTIQWRVSSDGGTIFNDIVGETNNTLTFNALTMQNGNQYSAVFTNSCGIATTIAATLEVNDDVLPSITCPSNTVVNPTSLSGAVVTYTTPVGSDNCSGASTTQTAGLPSGSTFPIGITTNSFVVTDASSNTATCSFTVEVSDPTCDPNKVYVCHNGTTICVNVNSLPAHLNHGDNLGECAWYPKMNTEPSVTLPTSISLEQNHPNPFTTSSEIRYTIANDAHVLLRVFDLFGREVKTIVNAQQQKGSHNVTIDGHNLSGGMYIYRLDANGEARTGRMMLVR